MDEMKGELGSIRNAMDQLQESICSTEDRTLEITESQENRGKRMKKSEKSPYKLQIKSRYVI